MAATTTAFKNLLNALKRDFPDIHFSQGETFRWSPSTNTVVYVNSHPEDQITLLHETAHGALGHNHYSYDIDLLKLEREAWNTARLLGDTYNVQITDDIIEDALDTYRDWLHARSLCPTCAQNGIQTGLRAYSCVVCGHSWRVNDARTCGLRRHAL